MGDIQKGPSGGLRGRMGGAVAYGEDSLRMALGAHVSVMDLLQHHPGLVVLPILEPQTEFPSCYPGLPGPLTQPLPSV